MHILRIVLPLCISREQYLLLLLFYVPISLPLHTKKVCLYCLFSFVVLLYEDMDMLWKSAMTASLLVLTLIAVLIVLSV